MVDTLLQAQLSLIILLLIIGEKVGVEALSAFFLLRFQPVSQIGARLLQPKILPSFLSPGFPLPLQIPVLRGLHLPPRAVLWGLHLPPPSTRPQPLSFVFCRPSRGSFPPPSLRPPSRVG